MSLSFLKLLFLIGVLSHTQVLSNKSTQESQSEFLNLKKQFESSAALKNTEIKYAAIKKSNNNKKFIIIDSNFELNDDTIAIAKYTLGLLTIGWDLLAIKTNKKFDDLTQAEAAGYLEGFLTRERIYNHWRNLHIKTWGENKQMPENVKEFLQAQKNFVEESFKKNENDPVIYNAYLLNIQFTGLINGYNENLIHNITKQIDFFDFHTISSFGDLFDIIHYKNRQSRPEFSKMSTEDIISHIHRTNHCSAIFKAKEDFSDIYFGHNSWFYYSASTRIFKEYNFNFNHPSVKSRNIIFSSYPATLASTDDFYITSQNLAIIETTNSLFDNDLFNKLTPESLLCWQRAMISSRISTSAKSWVENFSKLNSGTYNNQFMVLDMKKVDLDQRKILNGAMYIVEQIPGFFEINEVTEYLKYGYWPSYNTPFSPEIRRLSKINEMVLKTPELKHTLDYDTCARANIFRRDQGKVNCEENFKKLIRQNDYKNDSLSLGKPSYAIASRVDLDKQCMGAYDSKTSSVKHAIGKYKKVNIIIGPTNEQVATFKWEESVVCKNDPRFGLPEKYDFNWYEYQSEFYDEEIYKDDEPKDASLIYLG